jgi:hypothetical protein
MFKSIPGNRAAFEMELVAALIDPARRDRFETLLARLEHRGTLTLIQTSQSVVEVTPAPDGRYPGGPTKGGADA